jgi:uncharacterized protein YjiS (DUF1127 family)
MTAIHFERAQGRFTGVRPRSAAQRASAAAGRVSATFRAWRRRARDRADLAALDDRMLADIGISRADADYLGNKPFWKE